MSETKRIEIDGGRFWAEVEALESGLFVVSRSHPEMFVTALSIEDIERILPLIVADMMTRPSPPEAFT